MIDSMKKYTLFLNISLIFLSIQPAQTGYFKSLLGRLHQIRTAFQNNPHLAKSLKQKGDAPHELLQTNDDDTNLIQILQEEWTKNNSEMSPDVFFTAIARIYPTLGNAIAWTTNNPRFASPPTPSPTKHPLFPPPPSSSKIPIIDVGVLCSVKPSIFPS